MQACDATTNPCTTCWDFCKTTTSRACVRGYVEALPDIFGDQNSRSDTSNDYTCGEDGEDGDNIVANANGVRGCVCRFGDPDSGQINATSCEARSDCKVSDDGEKCESDGYQSAAKQKKGFCSAPANLASNKCSYAFWAAGRPSSSAVGSYSAEAPNGYHWGPQIPTDTGDNAWHLLNVDAGTAAQCGEPASVGSWYADPFVKAPVGGYVMHSFNGSFAERRAKCKAAHPAGKGGDLAIIRNWADQHRAEKACTDPPCHTGLYKFEQPMDGWQWPDGTAESCDSYSNDDRRWTQYNFDPYPGEPYYARCGLGEADADVKEAKKEACKKSSIFGCQPYMKSSNAKHSRSTASVFPWNSGSEGGCAGEQGGSGSGNWGFVCTSCKCMHQTETRCCL